MQEDQAYPVHSAKLRSAKDQIITLYSCKLKIFTQDQIN